MRNRYSVLQRCPQLLTLRAATSFNTKSQLNENCHAYFINVKLFFQRVRGGRFQRHCLVREGTFMHEIPIDKPSDCSVVLASAPSFSTALLTDDVSFEAVFCLKDSFFLGTKSLGVPFTMRPPPPVDLCRPSIVSLSSLQTAIPKDPIHVSHSR